MNYINLKVVLKEMKRILILVGILIFSISHIKISFGANIWPNNISIEADGGIIMEAQTGTILYEKNMYEHYYPASITKILTALIVLENCELDETVVFSHKAIFDVEANSKNANLAEGDMLTVEECLYVLLLYSANEVANALAEHVAGSIENFANMMNEKAKTLGCKDSNFVNPSGLNDPNHYTCAYDMALIAQEAYRNTTLLKISGTPTYVIPPTKNCPSGQEISIGHKMLKKNWPDYYDSRVIAGKTGYTSLAGNTLVTFAEQDNLKLIVVILNGHSTHYSDTSKLLEFGFENFEIHEISKAAFEPVQEDLNLGGIPLNSTQISVANNYICLPKEAEREQVDKEVIVCGVNNKNKEEEIKINYYYLGKQVGKVNIFLQPEESELEDDSLTIESETGENPKTEKLNNRKKKIFIFVGSGISTFIILFCIAKRYYDRKRRKLHFERIKKLCGENEKVYYNYLHRSDYQRKRNKYRKKNPVKDYWK